MGRRQREEAEPYRAIHQLCKDGLGAIVKTVRINKIINSAFSF